jgi:hypothetical protein
MWQGIASLAIKRSLKPALSLCDFPINTITKLDVADNHLGPHTFNALMILAIKCPALTELNASSTMANNDSCTSVARLVSSSSTLLRLDVSNNPFTTSIAYVPPSIVISPRASPHVQLIRNI